MTFLKRKSAFTTSEKPRSRYTVQTYNNARFLWSLFSSSRSQKCALVRLHFIILSMKPSFFDLLVCPVCKGSLQKSEEPHTELICHRCALAFEVRNDIAVMIKDRARPLTAEEVEAWRSKVTPLVQPE